MTDKIQIVVIDDHPLFRDGVVNSIQADSEFEVVGQGATAAEAERLTADRLPDILLLDISIPGGGLDAAARLSAHFPVVKIVMLTASERDEDLLAALKVGVRGYVLKGVGSRELIRILLAVSAGEAYV